MQFPKKQKPTTPKSGGRSSWKASRKVEWFVRTLQMFEIQSKCSESLKTSQILRPLEIQIIRRDFKTKSDKIYQWNLKPFKSPQTWDCSRYKNHSTSFRSSFDVTLFINSPLELIANFFSNQNSSRAEMNFNK